ncbi:MAG: hypothetical protein KBG63_06150, partial [Acetobacterium sp.]|nr:hypothetical protein [Acetobacterium sp.]
VVFSNYTDLSPGVQSNQTIVRLEFTLLLFIYNHYIKRTTKNPPPVGFNLILPSFLNRQHDLLLLAILPIQQLTYRIIVPGAG